MTTTRWDATIGRWVRQAGCGSAWDPSVSECVEYGKAAAQELGKLAALQHLPSPSNPLAPKTLIPR
jgi:hypothetical protein